MASRRPPPEPVEPHLTIPQMRNRIERLRRCVSEIEAFDPEQVQKRYNITEVVSLEASITDALAAAFGEGTPRYNRFKSAADLDQGLRTMRLGTGFGGGPTPNYDAQDAILARKYLAEGKERSVALLGQAVRALEDAIQDAGGDAPDAIAVVDDVPTAAPVRKVFVVHGHDEGAREAVARFLEQIGFEAIILHEQANRGRTVIEKVEAHGDVGFAVVLLTPDDHGAKEGEALRPRARQNVVLELGYFIGRLGRERVCALTRGDIELPLDFGGVVYETYDASGGWRQAIGRELQAAGFEINWNRVMRP